MMSQDTTSLLGTSSGEIIEPESVSSSRHSTKAKKLRQYVAALSATLSALSAGIVLGWTSPILTQLEGGKLHSITVNDSQIGWIGSFITIGAMATCIPTGFICDLIGRKKTLLLFTIPLVIGWTLILFATSIIMLYFGRLIVGMGVGACCVAAPLYCNEIASKDIRGTLGSYFQLMVTIGVFLAYSIGSLLPLIHYTIFCASFPILFAVVFAFQPESPVYCLQNGLTDEALKSLIVLRGPHYDHQAEMREIDEQIKENVITGSIFSPFRRKCNKKALVIALSLMFFQQFSGINSVILYISNIFKSAGVKFNVDVASVIVGAVQAIATFLSSLAVDRLGRRVLLLFSAGVMSLSALTLALYFTLKMHHVVDAHVIETFTFVPVISLCVFVIVFSLGFGPIPWMMSAEIFSPELKSVAGAIAGTTNWFLAFLITKFYLQVSDSLGQDTVFFVFSSISAFGVVFIYFIVPETKGKSIEEIQAELEN